MDAITKLPKKHFYIIIAALAIIILSLSLEVMMKVKDITLYKDWINNALKDGMSFNYDESFSIYVTANLSKFFQNLVVPMALGIHSYVALIKIRINKLFVFMWTVLLIGAGLFIGIELNLNSVFYYITVLFYIILVVTILSLISVIDENKFA